MMVGATPQQQQQQGTSAAPSAEDEALKRNTDCVYFLTSPLACKKGAECEYRHSEYARVNPRDCYFWLNGNCLNPKCGFRHPPLDGLFGTETEASVGSVLPLMPMAAVPAIHAPQNPAKAPVQCFYFHKGYCSKGDKCGFLHGPNPSNSKGSQPMKPSPSTELPPSKLHTIHQKFSQEVKTQQTNFAKPVVAPVEIKPAPKLETGSRKTGIDRNLPPSKNLQDEVPIYKPTNLPLAVNGNNPSRYNRMHQLQLPEDHGFPNGKDTDEIPRESSPGFDVLVDDELRNSDFYHGEDRYGRTRGHKGRNTNPVDEYDIDHSVDYNNSVGDLDRETYRDLRGYDNYENIQGQYDYRSLSSERVLLGQPHLESRNLTDDVDLRYRLSKHRRANGLRSVVTHDFATDKNVEDRGYRGSSPRESSISGRLRGRIKLPRSPSRTDFHVERERERARSRGRLSPVRPPHQGRFRDRIKARVEEDYDSEGRNPRGGRTRREMMDDRSVRFPGPKSLAELKGSTSSEPLRKRKLSEDDNYQPSEGDLSFKGPMPLSEILKRKRVSETGISATDKHDSNQKEQKEVNESNKRAVNNDDGSKSTAVENEVGHDQDFSEPPDQGEPETESGTIAGDGMEDEQYEDQREGEYEYEQVDEGEYYEEGENAEAEEDDDDDFAKKIGVVFS